MDSSVVVAALASWHEAHEIARREAHGQFVPAHALVESYAVLTRLPPPRRVGGATAQTLLATWFPPSRVLHPRRGSVGTFLTRMAGAGVSGGAAYDALVGLTAAGHGHVLLTRDRRAEPTYQRLGIEYRFVD
ncbi:MAG: PIN domain-containing protein [Acidimicrobiales bacterium]